MSRKVYFGNDQKQSWIIPPKTGMQAGSRGYVFEQQLLSGSTFVKRSDASHRRFEMSWLGSLNSPDLEDSLRIIKDFSDGLYGDSKLFWNDPYATTSNMFSPAWAAPFMSIGTDWDAICPDDVGVTKEVVTTASISSLVGANTQGYPANSAKFTAPGSPTLESDKFTFYVPSGYTLWLGLHGHHGTTGAAFGKAYKNGVAATPTNITPLGVNTGTRVNTGFSSSVADKVEFYLAKIDSGQCTFHISGLIAQILPTGTSPTTGNFISGRGTTGLKFASFPEIEYYSSNINDGQVGMSVSLAEI
jgi:hypothetical protein